MKRASAGGCAGFSKFASTFCLLSLDWGHLEGSGCRHSFCPCSPACIWNSLHSTARDFQISAAEPFPPPTFSTGNTQQCSGVCSQVGGVGKGGVPHLVQCVRLVRVLLPAALGRHPVLLFLLQLPLVLLRVLRGTSQAFRSWQWLVPSVLAFQKATSFPSQVPKGCFSQKPPLAPLESTYPVAGMAQLVGMPASLCRCPMRISRCGRTNEEARRL